MKIIQTSLICLFLFPVISEAEIWMYQINGKQVMDCAKRPEVTIDEAWNTLEKFTGVKFEIAPDSKLVPGYILSNRELNMDYVFYPSKHACEFERVGMVAMMSEDREQLNKIAKDMSEEDKLAAMTPIDIPPDRRKIWLHTFVGCTDGALENQISPKGRLQAVINSCDCMAREVTILEGIDIDASQEKIAEKMPDILKSCS